jgi:uncharacterized membrane protein
VHWGGTFTTTFLASSVEAIEMVAVVVGVGTIRGWRATLVGTAAGFVVLLVVGVGLGSALTAIPIDVLRLVVGTLILIFGLQWLSKGVRRVARKGLAGDEEELPGELGTETRFGLDWTSFVLAFKAVVLEGLEIAFIVVTFGSASGRLGLAAIAGAAALLLVGVLGAAFHGSLSRIPRSALILAVGLLLSTFGTYWAAHGAGVDWPGGELALPILLGLFAAVAAALVVLQRREAPVLAGEVAG